MTKKNLKIAFYGSSLVSAYWNGAATYYRGIIKELSKRGHEITFYEPDAFERQAHRDMEDPDWAKVVVYSADEEHVHRVLEDSKNADVLIKASGVGVFDELLEREVLNFRQPGQIAVFWDVDAPATLQRMNDDPNDPFRHLLPQYDVVMTYGGGKPVINKYEAFGAKQCIPVYNALDPETHFPVEEKAEYQCDLAFLGNRLPDREKRVKEFFLKPAENLPHHSFIMGGNGWQPEKLPGNIKYLGHVYTKDHNAFNCSPKAVLNISRDSMAENGFSPATRVFEAAGAGACLITDYWKGLEMFLEPGKEVLVAHDGAEVANILQELDEEKATEIGNSARKRMLKEHTYAHRSELVQETLLSLLDQQKEPAGTTTKI